VHFAYIIIQDFLASQTSPVPGLSDKKGGRRCHLSLNKRGHLFHPCFGKFFFPFKNRPSESYRTDSIASIDVKIGSPDLAHFASTRLLLPRL
jgi:hypothetical protein